MHNPTLQRGSQSFGTHSATSLRAWCFGKMLSLFPFISRTDCIPFHNLFLGYIMSGGNSFLNLAALRQWVVMLRVKAKKSIFHQNWPTLNAALLSTSIVFNFMQCGQYHLFVLHQFDRLSQGPQDYQLHPYACYIWWCSWAGWLPHNCVDLNPNVLLVCKANLYGH